MRNVPFIYILALLAAACAADAGRGTDSSVASTVATSGDPLNAPEIAAATFPSVVLLTMSDEYGQPLSLGSGFFVRPGVIATNYHVIAGAASGSAKRIGRDETFDLRGVLKSDPGHDLALLAVESDSPTLPLGAQVPNVGDAVYAIGNPHGFEGTFSPGIVSAVRNLGSDSLLQITAPISPGSSGGPVVNDRGDVIGIATATVADGQNLNFAVPSGALRTLLDGAQEEPIPFSTARSENESLFSRLQGERPTAGVEGDRLQWSGPYDFQSEYTLSLRNKLQQPVTNVYALVVFHDREGIPLETDLILFSDLLPPGLARRVHGEVDPSVKRDDRGTALRFLQNDTLHQG